MLLSLRSAPHGCCVAELVQKGMPLASLGSFCCGLAELLLEPHWQCGSCKHQQQSNQLNVPIKSTNYLVDSWPTQGCNNRSTEKKHLMLPFRDDGEAEESEHEVGPFGC